MTLPDDPRIRTQGARVPRALTPHDSLAENLTELVDLMAPESSEADARTLDSPLETLPTSVGHAEMVEASKRYGMDWERPDLGVRK